MIVFLVIVIPIIFFMLGATGGELYCLKKLAVGDKETANKLEVVFLRLEQSKRKDK